MPRCLCTSEKPSWRSCLLSGFRLQTFWAGSEGSSPSWGNSEHLVELVQWRVYRSTALLEKDLLHLAGRSPAAEWCEQSHEEAAHQQLLFYISSGPRGRRDICWSSIVTSRHHFGLNKHWRRSPQHPWLHPSWPRNSSAAQGCLASLLQCFVIVTHFHFSRAYDKHPN